MKKEAVAYLSIIISISLGAGIIIANLIQENRALKAQTPFLVEGEKIEYFNLIGVDEQVVDESILEKERTSLVFIFSRPCSPCNRNIVFWNRMADILKDDVRLFGIVLDNFNQARQLYQSKELHFNIYVPVDLNRFIDKWRLKLDLAQTILYHDLKVKMAKFGDLNGQSFTEVVSTVKKLTAEKSR